MSCWSWFNEGETELKAKCPKLISLTEFPTTPVLWPYYSSKQAGPPCHKCQRAPSTLSIESMYILLKLYNLYSPVEKLAPFRSYGFLHTTYICKLLLHTSKKQKKSSQPAREIPVTLLVQICRDQDSNKDASWASSRDRLTGYDSGLVSPSPTSTASYIGCGIPSKMKCEIPSLSKKQGGNASYLKRLRIYHCRINITLS